MLDSSCKFLLICMLCITGMPLVYADSGAVWSTVSDISLPVAIILVILLVTVLLIQKKRIKSYENKVNATHDVIAQALSRTKRDMERIRQACELVSLIYFEYDMQRKVFTGDSRFFKFFAGSVKPSITLDEVLAQLHPDDRSLCESFTRITKDADIGDSIKFSGRVYDTYNNLCYVQIYVKSVCDDAGNLIVRRGSILDITEQKKRETDLFKINQQFEFIQRMAKIYSWEINISEPDYIRFSKDFYHILGDGYLNAEKVQTAVLREVFADEDYNTVVNGFNSCFLSKDSFDITLPLYPKTGLDIMYVHIVAFSNFDREYAEEGLIFGIIQDVTDLKHAEHRAGHAEKMKALGRLASSIAHDFNNQLSGILGFAELIKMEDTSEVVLEYTNMIIDRGDKSAALIKKLLDFSRNQKEEAELIDVDELIQDTIDFFAHLSGKSINIKKNIRSPGLGVLGNYNELQNALLNLCLNSRDAIGDNTGNITLTVDTELVSSEQAKELKVNIGKFAVIKVLDDGHGMSSDVLEKILEPFFTTKAEGKGTGLGLSTVHGAITAIAGGMTITSEVGKGTEVRLYIPVASDKAIFGKLKKTKLSRIKHGVGHVLIIDDDKSLVKLLTMQLEKAGYEITGINDPVKAVKEYAMNYAKFDIVILDMIMPDMNGAEVFKELLAVNPEVKAILMSGYSDDELFEKAKANGIKHFLTKPVTLTALTKKVSEVLNAEEQESE